MTCGANSSYALADYVRQSAIDVGQYPGYEIPDKYSKPNIDFEEFKIQLDSDDKVLLSIDTLRNAIYSSAGPVIVANMGKVFAASFSIFTTIPLATIDIFRSSKNEGQIQAVITGLAGAATTE